MTPLHPSSRYLVFASFAVLTAGRVMADPASVNPFLPPAAAASAAPTAGATIEFRGFAEDNEGLRFRIYDPARKTGVWVKLNQRDATMDVLAKQFNNNPDSETLVVEYQGRTLTLAQRTSKIVSSGSAAQGITMAPPNPGVNVPPAVTQAVVVNPTPADEQRRLEAVASEVARRRALREQAAQNMTQGAAPAQPQVQPQIQPQQQMQPVPQQGQPGRSNQPRPQRP